MSLRARISSAHSLARLTFDIAVGLVLAIPTILMQALAATIPHLSLARLISHIPFLEPYQFLLNPPNTLSTLRSRHTPPIAISRRYLYVHNRLMVTEELSIPAEVVEAAPITTFPLPPPPPPPVHLFLISGNPGTVHFYLHFLSHLHQLSHRSLHIHSLSFAGHQSLATLNLSVSAQPLYDLQQQTDMWLTYLTEWMDRQGEVGEVVLCGHSIGAWMALELHDRLGSDRIFHSFLLFPTLSRMSHTPAGRRLQYPFAYGRPLLVPLAGLLIAVVPAVLLRLLARHVMSASHPHTTANSRTELHDTANTVVDLFSPHIVAQCLYLAHSELQTVVDERPSHSRLMAEGRATLVSGAADEWDPAVLQQDRRRLIKGLREVRMEADVKHAFVAGSSERVAEVVWQELQKLIQPQLNGTATQRLHKAAHVVV